MDRKIHKKINLYQATVIFSVFVAMLGFSYNVWRMEVSEENNTIRTACFEILIKLSSLEQLIYAAHYDNDLKEGNPRKGWVTVGLIDDLSILTGDAIKTQSSALKKVWSNNWKTMPKNRDSIDQIVAAIDSVRTEIKQLLVSLQ